MLWRHRLLCYSVENEKEAIPATPTAVGKPLETVDEEEAEPQPMAEGTTTSAGSGVARPWHTASGGDASEPMDESISARRAWTGDTVGESPEKRARVGGIYVGTLYAPTEDIVVGEEDVEMVQYDSDGEENKPMTPEEIAEGDEAEFDKMDKYETYDPVERQPGMRVLDATWVRRRKPDGSIRCRYCVREFKRGDPRRDVFAVASSTSTSRVIDVIGVKMGYGFMTADAENTFWQVPISEEAYMEAPKEWIARQEARGIEIPNNVVWKLKKEWYGHRIAGQTFVEWTAGHLGEIGFGRNPAAPWLFYNSASGVVIEVHMADVYATGPMKALKDLKMQIRDRIKMKSQIHP